MRLKAWAGAMALAAIAIGGPAGANGGMTAAYGNTILSTYPDGGWVKHWFDPDNSYAARFSDGRRLTARWRIEGRNVCLTNIRPNMFVPRFCSRMVEARVGDTWTSRDPLGRRVSNTLVAGRN